MKTSEIISRVHEVNSNLKWVSWDLEMIPREAYWGLDQDDVLAKYVAKKEEFRELEEELQELKEELRIRPRVRNVEKAMAMTPEIKTEPWEDDDVLPF